MTVQMDKYKVCIRCITYNHSEYITDALNGFASQQTDFPFIILLMDDASTDGEQEVIKAYIDEHFDLSDTETSYTKDTDDAEIIYARHKTNTNCYIAAFCLKTNHYQAGKDKIKYVEQWRNASDYEAICEGDDYWIDPLKLQKQVDFLDANPQCGLSYTEAVIVNEDPSKVVRRWTKGVSKNICQYIMIKGNPIVTASVCVRRPLYDEYIREQATFEVKARMGDVPLWVYITKDHPVHYCKDKTVAYRVLANSASHSPDPQKLRDFYRNSLDIKIYMNRRYNIGVSETRMWRGYYKTILRTMCGFSRTHMWEAVKEVAVKSPLALFDLKVIFYLAKRCILNK